MIETLLSLKTVFLFLISILVLNELFVGIQVAETTNFFALRARHVDQDIQKVDDFYNKTILKYLIFTKQNPFLSIRNIKTTENQTKQLKTTLPYAFLFSWAIDPTHSTSFLTVTPEIQQP